MDWLRKIPIGQYVPTQGCWLTRIDPRLKMAWVLMFLISPVLAGPYWRIGLVAGLFSLTVLSNLPLRIWWRPFLLVIVLAIAVGCFSMFLPTGELSATLASRSPQELSNVIAEGPSWQLFKFGPFRLGGFDLGPVLVNRRSAELGLNTSTLIFTVVHSVNLMLLTTSPEELMWSLRWFISPLAFFGVPIDRLSFQLLLSLRFLPLVQEEFQNLLRSLASRAVNLRKLGVKATLGLLLSVAERLLANILLRAEQGADALIARGGQLLPPDQFRPKTVLRQSSILINIGSGLLLMLVLSLRRKYGAL